MDWLSCMEAAIEWVEAAYPAEGCGLVVATSSGHRFIPCANHAASPRVSFALDPLEIVRSANRGEALVAIVHSHPDAPAEFSRDDIAGALMPGGGPAYPQVDYAVISVQDAVARQASVYRYSVQAVEFEPVFFAELVSR